MQLSMLLNIRKGPGIVLGLPNSNVPNTSWHGLRACVVSNRQQQTACGHPALKIKRV